MCSIFTQYHTIFTLFEVVQIGITAPIQNNESLIMSCGSFKAHSAMPGRDGRKGNPPSSTVQMRNAAAKLYNSNRLFNSNWTDYEAVWGGTGTGPGNSKPSQRDIIYTHFTTVLQKIRHTHNSSVCPNP